MQIMAVIFKLSLKKLNENYCLYYLVIRKQNLEFATARTEWLTREMCIRLQFMAHPVFFGR